MKAATLLCEFIQAQPPHLYVALETPLFNNLLRCLQLDSSTTVASLTLTALTMLLPHSPASLVPRLPTLFNIYARLLFWHRQLPESTDLTRDQHHPKPLIDPAGWETCSYSPDFDGNSISSLRIYFTILYGLYPINLMDYIRKPYRYLRHANDPSVDVVEVQPSEIRHKSEEFQRCHLLHPNFYHLTIESEKTDHGRWQASEPAEVVADCTALCIAEDQREPERAEDDDDARRQSSLFSKDEANSSIPDLALLRAVPTNDGVKSGQLSRRGSADTRPRSAAGPGDSPTLPSQLAVSPSQTQLQDLINSNKAIKSGLNQSLANDSVPSLSLSQQELNAETKGGSAQPATRSRATSSLSTPDPSSLVSQLRRQVLLLQNDLSFERYLKQQHMAHMGELRRRQVKEAASEAEMQNLIIANRNLKSRFEDAKNTEMQVKKESEKSRSLAKKWEADLSAKLKVMREDNKKIKAQVAELEHEVGRSSAECEELKAQLCACEVRELQWNQNIQAYEVDMSEMDRLKSEVERLTVTERDYQARKAEMERAAAAVEEAESEIRVLNVKLEAQDEDLQRTIQAYESQLATLKSRVTEQGHAASSERPTSSTHHAVEAALSASRAKQAELQKQYDLLSRKYTALQSSLFDMQCDLSAGAGPSKSSPAARHDGDDAQGHASPLSSSPTQPRGRVQREFSSSDAFEAAAGYHGMPTLGARSSTSTAGPSEAGTSSSAAAPGADPRSQGRGMSVFPWISPRVPGPWRPVRVESRANLLQAAWGAGSGKRERRGRRRRAIRTRTRIRRIGSWGV